MNRVVCKLKGGLGNQLFEYAIARTVADKCSAKLTVDTSELSESFGAVRRYGMDNLSISAPVGEGPACQVKIHMWPRGPQAHAWAEFSDGKWLRLDVGDIVAEVSSLEVQSAELRGFVFGEGAFSHSSARKEFAMDLDFTQPMLTGSESSVAVHVRRGDTLTHAHSASGYIVNLGMDYYRLAMSHMEEAVPGCHFMVFSDEPGWCKENFPGCEVMDGSPQVDLAVMRQCKHHIIANSTFSWWGAWLGQSQGQIVISPRQWFKDGLGESDIAPSKWLKM